MLGIPLEEGYGKLSRRLSCPFLWSGQVGAWILQVFPRAVGATKTKEAQGSHPAASISPYPPACPCPGSPWQFLAAGLSSIALWIDPSEKTVDFCPLQRKGSQQASGGPGQKL